MQHKANKRVFPSFSTRCIERGKATPDTDKEAQLGAPHDKLTPENLATLSAYEMQHFILHEREVTDTEHAEVASRGGTCSPEVHHYQKLQTRDIVGNSYEIVSVINDGSKKWNRNLWERENGTSGAAKTSPAEPTYQQLQTGTINEPSVYQTVGRMSTEQALSEAFQSNSESKEETCCSLEVAGTDDGGDGTCESTSVGQNSVCR